MTRSTRHHNPRTEDAMGWGPHHRGAGVVRIVLIVVALCVFSAPFIVVLSGAFDAKASSSGLKLWPTEPTLLNFEVAGQRGIWGYMANSLVIVGGGLLLQVTLSVLAAYALSRRNFRWAGIVLLVFLLTMMLPEEVIAVPLSQVIGNLPLLGINLKGTVWGVILPVGCWGFSVLMMSEFMKELPDEIEEAARLDGVGELRMLWSIVLPLCKPVLGVITIFGFMMIWDQYLLPLIAAKDSSDYTLTVALSIIRGDYQVGQGAVLAGALLALVPSLIVYLLLQRSLIQGITAGATKG